MKRILFLVLLGAACQRMALSQISTLDLRIISQGKPAAARVYIQAPGGHYYTVPGAVKYAKFCEIHSYINGAASVPLSPGRYEIRAEKGPEYGRLEHSVFLPPGKTVHVEMDLPRLVDMNAEGWYSGDLHLHRTPGDMPIILRAEDLNIGPVIARHVGFFRPAVINPYPQEATETVGATHVIGLQVQEVERNQHHGHGAALFFNVPQSLPPTLPWLFPTVTMLCRQIRSEGGFVDAEKPLWRWVPVGVALGLVDSVGVVNNHFRPHEVATDSEQVGGIDRTRPDELTVTGFANWLMGLYYSYLNCGRRLAASAGSASGFMPSWPGYERVYVSLSGPFSYQQWFKDLKAGRSVATNGPLLRVKMNGNPPGSETEWKPGLTADVDIQIDAQDPLDRLEVVFNGKVIKKISLAGRRKWRSEVPIKVASPGWVAVRCYEPETDTLRYAQSSPFYFPRDGKLPVQAADARRWETFMQDMIARSDRSWYPSREDFDKAMAEYHEAENIYRDLANGAQSSAQHDGEVK